MKLSLLTTSLLVGWLWSLPVGNPQRIQHEPVDPNKLYLPDDLEATLWAEGPMFYNPTNMDLDARGRVWITEAVDYRDFNNKPDTHLTHPNGERVMILEDTDHDGKADKSTVFVEDKELVSPLGIAVLGNKVYVSCAPSLVVYTDENGDDKADKKEIFLTGFGGLDHDHSLHAMVAGPDGNFYFNTGNAGPHHVTDKAGWTLRSGSLYVGGTPYNKLNKGNQVSDDGRVWVGGLALRVRPDGTGLKVMAHNFRNNYETGIDSYGNLFQNDNDDQVVACRTSFLMEGANAGYFSSDGTRYWQADQRPAQTIPTAHWHQQDPGVMPAGNISGAGSPTGVVVYEGDELGEAYRGTLLSAEAGRNVIFGYKLNPQGAGYDLSNRRDLISTFPKVDENYKWNDVGDDPRKWFRPSDVSVGPDGAIYIADWYDPIVGGHAMHDKKGYGRIFRITPKGKNLTVPKLDLATTKGQILALQSPAINVRLLGFNALRRQGDAVVKPVAKLLTAPNPYHRARAIWLLSQLGPKGRDLATNAMTNADPQLRLTAFRALKTPFSFVTPNVIPLCQQLVNDPSLAVRREVAIALRDVPVAQSVPLLLTLMEQYDSKDRYYLTALGIGAQGKESALYQAIKSAIPQNPSDWNAKLADLLWEIHPAEATDLFTKWASSQTLTADARQQALTALGFVRTPMAARAMVELAKSTDTTLAKQATYWVNFRRGNDWATLVNWDELMPNKLSDAEQKVLALRQQLLDEYVSDADKKKVAVGMAQTPEGGRVLVGLAADKKLPQGVVGAVSEVIFSNPDQSVRTMASDYFSKHGTTRTVSIRQITSLTGDATAGKTVFATNCATCHKHGSSGAEIGPELTKIHEKFDRNGLLDAIVNPSAALAFGYEPWLITTKNGQTYYGFLISDGAQAIVVKDAAGQKHTLPTAQVVSRKQYTTSLMPDPVAMGLTDQQLADLSTFLLKR